MILEFAKRFARSGFYVFPTYKGKSGMVKPYGWAMNDLNGKDTADKAIPATNLEIEINQWPDKMQDYYKKEVAGYGILGRGCIIIDVDNKNGKNGSAEYDKLIDAFDIPRCQLIVKSKSGGFHLFFKKPDKFKDSYIKSISSITIEGVKYEGVDIRGDGGFVQGATAEGDWVEGVYTIIKGSPESELSELPPNLVQFLTASSSTHNDLDAIMSMSLSTTVLPSDRISMLKRGEMPAVIPTGERNESFFIYITALKNKGIDQSTTKTLALQLAQRCEDKSDLSASVDIDAMIERIFGKSIDNPYDVGMDLVERGLVMLTDIKSKPTYVLLEDNPYLQTKQPHDSASLKEMMGRFAKMVTDPQGRMKLVNPIDVAIRRIPPSQIVSSMAFKPGAPAIFQMTDDINAKRYLNTYQAPSIVSQPRKTPIWDMFKALVTRIYGPEGTDEYKLGIDFVAWMLQYPDLKTVISVYLISQNRGVGKSTYLDLITRVAGVNKLGERNAVIRKLDELGGRFFNPTGCLINIVDEVQFDIHRNVRQETSAFWRVLKNLITADTVEVELKGGGFYNLPNTASLILAGNSGSNFPVEEYDRRLWIIDNQSEILQKGHLDPVFELIKNTGKITGQQERIDMLDHLRWELFHHEISLPLDSMRAPMTAAKEQLYRAGLTELEDWWLSYFSDETNLFSKNAIISKSALMYMFESTDALDDPEMREKAYDTFKTAKKRGLIKPIVNEQGRPIQFRGHKIVGASGELYESEKSEYLFTTRNHNQLGKFTNQTYINMYHENLDTLMEYKSRSMRRRVATASDLLSNKMQ